MRTENEKEETEVAIKTLKSLSGENKIFTRQLISIKAVLNF